jgi:hypothetical protein
MDHHYLQGAGQIAHDTIDRRLPDEKEKALLAGLAAGGAPVTVAGARDDPEEALANLLSALEALGLIEDGTTAT